MNLQVERRRYESGVDPPSASVAPLPFVEIGVQSLPLFHQPILDPIPNRVLFPPIRQKPLSLSLRPSGARPLTVARVCPGPPEDSPLDSLTREEVATPKTQEGTARPPTVAPFFVANSCGNLVYFCFLLLGLGTLLPWNFFITADSYWQYKFRNTSEGEDTWKKRETHLQKLYDPMQVCFSQAAGFIFLFVNAMFSHLISAKVRLMGSLSVLLVLFALTAALVKVDTDSWQKGFFALTVIVIIIMSAFTAIFQGSLFGVAGRFPERFINGVSAGQALGGVFAAVARIASLFFAFDDVTSAFIYFSVAVLVMIVTLGELACVVRTRFFRHYTADDVSSTLKEATDALTKTEAQRRGFKNHLRIFGAIWPLALTVGGVFFVTLALFPAVCVNVVSSSVITVWADNYFQPVATFLLFNAADYLGRTASEFFLWPNRGSSMLYWFAGLRLVFIPLILVCNHRPTSLLPSLLLHDAWYMSFLGLFGLSNGYLSSLCMMYAPRCVPQGDAEEAASLMAAMVGLGLLLGSVVSFGLSLVT